MRKPRHREIHIYLRSYRFILSSRARIQLSRSGSDLLVFLTTGGSVLQMSSGTNFYLTTLREKQSLKGIKQSAASASHFFGPKYTQAHSSVLYRSK